MIAAPSSPRSGRAAQALALAAVAGVIAPAPAAGLSLMSVEEGAFGLFREACLHHRPEFGGTAEHVARYGVFDRLDDGSYAAGSGKRRVRVFAQGSVSLVPATCRVEAPGADMPQADADRRLGRMLERMLRHAVPAALERGPHEWRWQEPLAQGRASVDTSAGLHLRIDMNPSRAEAVE